ncbi:MAG: NAD-dependent epimerase/dehydratase family protein [Syntrophales bacterium]|nr:NAD-dependent epimerase/dehydratase family protein [Syntrophales bacterium]
MGRSDPYHPVAIAEGKRVVITGGAGYLASNIVSLIKDQHCFVTRFDRPGVVFSPVEGKCEVQDIHGDVRDDNVWSTLLAEADVVFHLAGQTSVYRAEENPLEDLEINVRPVVAMAAAARVLRRRPIVIFSGTVTQVGLTERLPVDESHPDDPITVYDLHKGMAEKHLRHFARTDVLHACTLRLSNLYGPGPRSSRPDRGVLNGMIKRALRNEPLTLFTPGHYLRDYLYVEDAARAFIAAWEHIENLNGDYFVIGSGVGYSLKEAFTMIIDRAAAVVGHRALLVMTPPPDSLHPIEKRNFIANATRFMKRTGWKAEVSLEAGIDRTIRYFLNTD